jgi:hypothetical protein
MNYIKLYENWLNEAQGEKLDSVLQKGLISSKKVIDMNLNNLSKFGKTFESQIRKNLDSLRGKYTSNSMWSNLSTKAGVENAISNFKELFSMSYGGRYAGSNSPLTGFTVKINNALNYLGDRDFFSGITVDNELWRSNEAVELKNIIVNGNEELARGLAASFILLDLGVAITNGMYYNAGVLTVKEWRQQNNVTLLSIIDSTITGKYTKMDELIDLGRQSRNFYRLRDVYRTPYNNSIKAEWKGFAIDATYSEFVPFVKGMSVDFLLSKISSSSMSTVEDPYELFAPLFVGHYMSDDANYSIDKAVEFMNAGGPSLLQNALSKF